jgi:PAS domain S-box-containing protein
MGCMASVDREPTSLALWQKAGLFIVAYYFCAELSRYLFQNDATAICFWLPAGLSIAVLLLNRTRDWPWFLAAAFPANFIFHWLHAPMPGGVICLYYLANVLQSLAGASLVRCFVIECPTLATLREFFGLLGFGAVLGVIPGALVAAFGHSPAPFTPDFVTASAIWWSDSTMAILLFTPFMLAWCSKSNRMTDFLRSPERNVELVFLIFALFIVIFLLLHGRPANGFVIGGSMILLLLWAGLRHGLRGATAVNLALSFAVSYFFARHPVASTASPVGSGEYFFPIPFVLIMASQLSLIPAILIGESTRSLERLRKSEEKFSKAFHTSPDVMSIVDLATHCYLEVNDAHEKVFGFKREEVIGRSAVEIGLLVNPALRDKAQAQLEATGSVRNLEIKARNRKGDLLTMLHSAEVIELDGRICSLRVSHDITEKKQAEQALRESEEKFSKAFHSSPDAVSISELKTGRIVDINDSFPRIYGYTRDEIIGRTSIELGMWQQPEDREEFVRRLARDGHIRGWAGIGRRRSGELFHRLISAEMIEIKGQPHVIIVIHDMTAQRRAEMALQASEEGLRATIENTPDVAVQWFDQRGRVTFWNKASENIYGWPSALAVGKTLDELIFTREQGGQFLQAIQKIEQSGKPVGPVEFPFRSRDGKSGVILSTLFKIQIQSGESRFVCMDVDLTQRKQAESLTSGQMQVLEMIAGGKPMAETLERLMRLMEAQAPDIICSILLLDPDGIHIRHGAAPSLPAELVHAVDGQAIGAEAGSCGTAAFRREPVLVANIETDPLWANYKHLALPHGLRACWSTPVFDEQRNLLGTFAIYHRQPGLPKEWHQRLINLATHTATVCIAKHRSETERQQAIAREQQARAEYTFQLLASQEVERTRIASELHDSLGQNLLLIKNHALLGMSREQLPEDLREQFQSISQLATRAIQETRHIAHDLHPQQLDLLGLTAALRALVQNTDESSAMIIKGKFDPVDDLFPRETANNLYRIVQESLNNILKHSRAQNARVTLEHDIHEVILKIEDDGCGFPIDGHHPGVKGMGLKNVKERVRMCGGRINLFSQPGQGTRIEITIPISADPR